MFEIMHLKNIVDPAQPLGGQEQQRATNPTKFLCSKEEIPGLPWWRSG